MSKEALISIIIPIYNAEQYLAECLDSILGQTYGNLEIILVNDGSVDASREICRQYQEQDNRIVFIEQENAGVSAARNQGIGMASGEYVMFVDADDSIAPWICEVSQQYMKDCDILMFRFGNSKEMVQKQQYPGRYVESIPGFFPEDCLNAILNSERSVLDGWNLRAVWGKLYRRSFLEAHQVTCPVGIINGEDMLFNVQVSMWEPKICYLPETGYFYRCNPSSAVHKYSPQLLENETRFYKELRDILDRKQLWEKYREDIDYQKVNGLLRAFSCDIFHPDNPKSNREKRNDFYELLGKEEVCSQISAQQKSFGFAKRCVLTFAKHKWYYLIKAMYLTKNLISTTQIKQDLLYKKKR